MKRIEFIAPVEAMRGNLSGKQTLVYADNDNPAYEAPVGRQYARNYRPSFIGAKRASDGRKYFSVKTKSATLITAASKKRMAILGAAGAVYGAILANKASATYTALVALFQKQNADIRAKGMRKYFCDWAFNALATKSQNISIPDLSIPAGAPVEVKNPWFNGEQTTGVEVSNEVLIKFWGILAPNGAYVYVDGVKVATFADYMWEETVSSAAWSGITLTTQTIGQDTFMKANGDFLTLNGAYIMQDDDIVPDAKYVTTEVAPEP